MEYRKIAIVTGGSSGLGLATAKKFIEQNIFTIITGRNRERLEKALHFLGGMCAVEVFDMNDLDKIPVLMQKISKLYGTPDVLVNNAGINMKKDFLEVSDTEFQNILLTDLTSVFAISREAAKAMIPRKQGCIINISSMAAHYGITKVVAYTAAKSGIEGMTRAMAVELAAYGIRVNCIAPGFIQTKMSTEALDRDPVRKEKVISRTPMHELGLPEDVANTAYFLASEGSRFITGAVIPVDGGNSIGF